MRGGNGLVDAGPAGCIAVDAVCQDVSFSCAARVGRILEEGVSPLARDVIKEHCFPWYWTT